MKKNYKKILVIVICSLILGVSLLSISNKQDVKKEEGSLQEAKLFINQEAIKGM